MSNVCQCICDECIADEAERDALRAEVEQLRAENERLTKDMAEQLDDSERIIAALVRERDALKAALRDIDEAVGICVSHGWTAGVRHRHLDPALQRAREALEGGGK